jgi:hypothetical protein
MPRPVAMRVSYGPDAAYLLRLAAAVKKDTRGSQSWIREVSRHLNCVTSLFLEAEAKNLGSVRGESKSGELSR